MHLNPETLLSRSMVAAILAGHGESCGQDKIGYYPELSAIAKRTSESKNWSEGEIFVFAESAARFIIMKQVAPASCEMFTVSNAGFHDVITAYRFAPEDLARSLNVFMDGASSTVPAVSNLPVKTDLVFSAAPGELGICWSKLCDAENELAAKLQALPLGAVAAYVNDAWFLAAEDDQLVLCHGAYADGQITEVDSRFDITLDWVDIDLPDLETYTAAVCQAVDAFTVVPGLYVASGDRS